MRAIVRWLLWVLVAVVAAQPAHAQTPEDCFQATLNLNTNQGHKAIDICTRVIKSGKVQGHELAVALNNRAAGYLANDDYDRALDDLNAALKISPKYQYALDARGEVWLHRKEYDRAIADHNAAIEIDPTFLASYYSRGRVYEAMGDFVRARAEYELVLGLAGEGRAIDKWAQEEARERLAYLNKIGK